MVQNGLIMVNIGYQWLMVVNNGLIMVSHGFPMVDSGQHIDRCNENGDPWLNCFLIFVDND